MTDPEPLAAETRGLVLRMLPDIASGCPIHALHIV